MTVCKICNTENDSKNYYCSYCGGVLRFPKSLKWFLVGLIVWPALIYSLYLFVKEIIYVKKIQKDNNVDINKLIFNSLKEERQKTENTKNTVNDIFSVKSYFLSSDRYRKKDGKVERGDCEIIIKNDNFYIKQNDEIIENYLGSVYLFDIWEYKKDTYFKFQMSSGNDYKFCSQNFEADKIADYFRKNDIAIEIEDNRND